jgi:hypothetical protein
LIILVVSPLKNSPALQQSYDQNDHGNDQKNVDQAGTDVERKKSQSPQNYQDDYNCFKHADLLFFFLSLAALRPSVIGWRDRLGRDHSLLCYFHAKFFLYSQQAEGYPF